MKACWIQGCPASPSRVAQLLWPDRLPVLTAMSPAAGSVASTLFLPQRPRVTANTATV
jgi:hypothetical protein